MLCRQATPETALQPFQGWPTHRTGSQRLSSTPLNTPCGTHMLPTQIPPTSFFMHHRLVVHFPVAGSEIITSPHRLANLYVSTPLRSHLLTQYNLLPLHHMDLLSYYASNIPLSPGTAMPYPSTPCGQATPEMALRPFLGLLTHRAGGLRLSSTLLDTPRRWPMIETFR
jgi:hypothetical protein